MNFQVLQRKVDEHKIFWWCITICLGMALRFIVMYVTNHIDFSNWFTSGSIVAAGKNIYANQRAYNYGPPFSMILGCLYKLTSGFANHALAFKTSLVSMLALANLCLSWIIVKKCGHLLGMLFFLNPVSIIVDGQNNQFFVLAILLATWGIFLMNKTYEDNRFTINDVFGTLLLSLSLITKHIFWAFPLWILMNANIPTRKKFLYAFVPPVLFLLSFVPYWSEGSQGIINNVFMYRSGNNYPLFALGIMNYYFGIYLPFQSKICFVIYIALISLGAYIFRHEKLTDSFLVYTICMVCFSSGIFGTYFVIPLAALFIYFKEKALYFFIPEATRFLAKGYSTGHIMYSLMVWCLVFYLIYYYRHYRRKKV